MKPIHVVSVLIGAVAIAAIVYFLCRPREMAPIIIYKTTPIDTRRGAETAGVRATATTTGGYPDAHRTPHPNGHVDAPETQISVQERLKAAMASPAYEAYTRKQAERVGFNIVLYWEFLEAAGIAHNGRILQAEAFAKYFPAGGSYADYKPMMELAVAEMFLEDPSQSVTDVLQRFNATRANRVWRFGHFNGYEGEYEWGQQIQRDAANIVATATRTPETFALPTFELPDFSNAPPDTEVSASDATPEDSPFDPLTAPPEEIPTSEALETLPQTLEALEAEFFKRYTTGIPDLPSDAALETTLRERFSPERFNTAMQTLHRHGPREGLRHLKTTDPEAAAYFERYLPPNTETDE